MLGQQEDETLTRLETLFKEMKSHEFTLSSAIGHDSPSTINSSRPDQANSEVIQTILGGDEDVGYAFKFSVTLRPDLIPDEPILVLEEILEPLAPATPRGVDH